MMQMLWLHFTEPRFDEYAFNTWRSAYEISIRNNYRSPEFRHSEATNDIIFNNHFRTASVKAEDLQAVNHEVAFDFYKSRFSSANGFKFIFVGNISRDDLHRYIETYIAPLPGDKVDMTIVDRNMRFNQVPERKDIYFGQDDKTIVSMVFTNDSVRDLSLKGDVGYFAVHQMLFDMLLENVRERMSGVYSISPRPIINIYDQIVFNINFGCSADRVEELMEAVYEQIRLLINNEFEDRYFTNMKEIQRSNTEMWRRTNGHWRHCFRVWRGHGIRWRK
jgi:zinc protease